jgi:hypothetical protein
MNPPFNPLIVTGTPTPAQECLLNERLDSLRRATESFAAPAHLEAVLLTAFKARHAGNHSCRRGGNLIASWFAPGIALVASVGMSAWMVLAPLARPALDPGIDSAAVASKFIDTPFIALQSLEQIAREPQPRVIETAVPRMWLASYGMAVSPEMAGDSLRAEMLVSASGQALAMRFLP